MSKTIKIARDPTGKITVSTEGFLGESCLETTSELEQALGMDQGNAEMTDEYHEGEDFAFEENVA